MRPACFPIAVTAMAATGKQRMRFGGADRDRTGDPLLAKQVLSQLSYSPTWGCLRLQVVGLGRVELPTSPLSGVRSNQLSYRPVLAAPPPALICIARSPAALNNLIQCLKGFEDKVERAERLSRSRPSRDGNRAKEGSDRAPVIRRQVTTATG